MRFCVFVILMLSQVTSFEQGAVKLSKLNCDCVGAVTITDTIIGPVMSPAGYGKTLEISGHDLKDPMWFEREHNTVWYKFKALYTTDLAMDIIPVMDKDDFDFLLFQSNSPAFCDAIAKGEIEPVRTNISKVNNVINGQTGLNYNSKVKFVAAGPGSPYSVAIHVIAGDTYYLIVDNPYRVNEGHTIVFHYLEKNNDTRPARVFSDTTSDNISRTIGVKIVDNTTNQSIEANLSIYGVNNNGFPLNVKSSSLYYFTSTQQYKTYSIHVNKKGYMMSVSKMVAGNNDTTLITVPIQIIEVGKKVTLQYIKFVGDKAEFLTTSQSSLAQLRDFMIENPEVSIEIQGYVNAPRERNKKKIKKLSVMRAQAVYNDLVLNNISKKRLKYQGFGNAKMIYPNPVTDQQAEANRRVEILITNR